MPIICPHCETSYAVDPERFGGSGRSVRCARCKEVWIARAVPEQALMPALSSIAGDFDAFDPARRAVDMPRIESPPLAAEAVAGPDPATGGPIIDAKDTSRPDRQPAARARVRPVKKPVKAKGSMRWPAAAVALASFVVALFIWRADVARALPQTAGFYASVGLAPNLRGLTFENVKLSTETVEGQSVLVIEGDIVGTLKRPVDVPRLRFVVRDEKGTAIYAWNTTPDQAIVQPGERLAFRSRLASPPAQATSLDVRFFSKRDLDGAA